MDEGETPRDCVIRECKEESNQNLRSSSLRYLGMAKYEKMDAAIFYSFVDEEEPFIENDEIRALRWWKLGEEIAGMDPCSLELIKLYVSVS